MAQNGEQVEELTLQGIIHGVGPWVIWFYPKPGAWLSNWLECYGFLRAFDCLPSSIRHSFSPYCFSILRIDPAKPPKPATPPPAAIPAAAPPAP